MVYRAKGEQLRDLDTGIGQQVQAWREALAKLHEATQALISTDKMTGNTADRMKNYFNAVYTSAFSVLDGVLMDYAGNWQAYFGAYGQVDHDAHFDIETDELEDIDEQLTYKKDSKGHVEWEVNGAVSSVSHLTSAHFGGLGFVLSSYQNAHNMLKKLAQDVEDVENGHKDADFTCVDGALQNLNALLNSVLGQDIIYKTHFDVQSFANSPVYQNLVNSYDALANDLNSKQEAIAKGAEFRKQQYEQLQREYEEEMEKRRKEAEKVKTGVMIGCVIIGTVVSVATLGAGTGVVIAATAASGALTGAAMSAVNTAADMYVAGGWDAVQWGEVGKQAFLGGIKGAITGAVSGGLTAGSAALGNGITSTVGKTAFNLASGTGTKVVNGMVDRFTCAIFEGESLGDSFSKAVDKKQLIGDGISGFTSSCVSAVFDAKFGGTSEDMGQYTPEEWYHKNVGNAVFKGSIKSTTSGAAARFTSTMYKEDGTLQEKLDAASKKALNTSELIADATSGGAGAWAEEKVKMEVRTRAYKSALEKAKYDNDTKGADTLEKLEADGYTGVKRTDETHNLDFSDATGPDGKPVVYVDESTGLSADVEFSMVDGKASGSDKTKFLDAYNEQLAKIDPSAPPLKDIPEGYTLHHVDTEVRADGTIVCRGQMVPIDANQGRSGRQYSGGNSEYNHTHTGGANQQKQYYIELEQYGGKAKDIEKSPDNGNENAPRKDDLSAVTTRNKAIRKAADDGRKNPLYKGNKDQKPKEYTDPFGEIKISATMPF